MKPLLILRPQPGADATAARARVLGLDPVVAPLFRISTIDWVPPDPALFDAVLMTSANAARFGGIALPRYHHLPVYAVGRATAAAAETVGFANIIAGKNDGAEAIALAVAQGRKRLLHLAGRDHIHLQHPAASIDRRMVYVAEGEQALPNAAREACGQGALALLHSLRSASLFAALVDEASIDRSGIIVTGLSEAVRAAAGDGWAGSFAASEPNDDALLAIAARLCDQGVGMAHGEDRA